MEPCISDFLDNCDANSDHNVTLIEWGQCLNESKGKSVGLSPQLGHSDRRRGGPTAVAAADSMAVGGGQPCIDSLFRSHVLTDALEDKCAEFKKLAESRSLE